MNQEKLRLALSVFQGRRVLISRESVRATGAKAQSSKDLPPLFVGSLRAYPQSHPGPRQNYAQKHPNREPDIRLSVHFHKSCEAVCGAGAGGMGRARCVHPVHPVGPQALLRADVGGCHALLVRARGRHRNGNAFGDGQPANERARSGHGLRPSQGRQQTYVPVTGVVTEQ